ncbi:uncharacterized protein HMPREF1541_09309 [Cyphellophora europaea CBS 101466]|uniref:C2H2 type master regulator of conidiophore development brlA n=1 Tax=Cyphellophora europaea (strain CBS 101466) TaxID=1220924 RepID=W2S9X0_CYPE1|nr:uncharacterized protein HMPREF1541_09309 [Cyphellophora europaea CBS 101466]ETN45477.1 hypothetical protein HMPREF1541_09309 [Cyphellophora europaea CBS 101466]
MVSITNQYHGQQILREAQQLRAARPGQQHITTDLPNPPQCAIYPNSQPSTPYDHMSINTAMSKQAMQYSNSPYFPYDMSPAVSPIQNQFPNVPRVDENAQHYFQNVHSDQDPNMIFDRRMSQPELRIQSVRPHTPSEQIQNAQYPLTPPGTQHVHHQQQMQNLRHQQATPPIFSPHPVSMQRGRSLQGIVEHDESKLQPNPIRQRPQSMLPTPAKDRSFEVADMPVPRHTGASSPSPQNEPSKNEALPFFDETGGEDTSSPAADLKSRPAPILISSQPKSGSQSPSRPALSPRRMSISDLNLEPGIHASIEETNISIDDIAQFIDGPEASDNKWVCKYENCNKRFGRKENIKSHVQTHLGDRQFKCDHCNKCFVRGHDLKRHAKIHTGTKPYPCLCGNSFARHDALTRHRQRGMCIGAFEGIVKKPIKRGRPRKHRPEMDDRLDKASRSRHAHELAHYATSSSSGSPSSWESPPTDTMDALSVRDDSPFSDVALFGMPNGASMSLNTDTASFPPEMFGFTPPTSPQWSTGNKASPAHYSPAPTDLGDYPQMTQSQAPSLPRLDERALMPNQATNITLGHGMQTGRSQQSQAHSLPALSHTSSSPPPAELVSFDFVEMPVTTASDALNINAARKLEQPNDFDAFLTDNFYDGTEMMADDSFFSMQ